MVNNFGFVFSTFVGVATVVKGNRDGLCESVGDVVGVMERERLGDEPLILFRISCSYKDRS